ncbi:hypothetical protein D9758_002156 [Tetrapyrgos nigripes]|uniref:non-specific serine/threonine protein kinase n=1 Tax=Tetrapyrgos nigripes TaxID=182062 RepID=A0A8H5GNN4_9AGAR|nr:hypothetical protein D9758_002156 [Tetrapyrgos nigripes]
MSTPQAFHPYQQNKGPLAPGQSISVNKYTVQVERYLSQGGFAHVYLVRTATPVYNTTHHVLKRIAVANEAMLTAVKKEVDIMRLLKGHPNIVHLIDAAWHRMSNGLYEVFILMEFCQGGGIIDMMNRRLRERLTEAEILQIFVDVCEGVAHMHNSRPPLLHRDLKVENILQSSPTSYKLCDFGSATTVSPRPPSNMQEIRLLEDDLNRHTTLQYRAPEMVDVHLRRPIDEKSDVWALGVLLYKLCYYTTPFEEHGPLAILNVQYRIPPYPVYSPQMNGLIGMMLREHGTQRPSVFELLAHVHTLRGTKSRFHYTIPTPQPLSPRQSSFKPAPSPNHLESTISYRQAPSMASNVGTNVKSPVNAGIQARDKVLEAIAPMRRGRPTANKESSLSRPASPDRNTPDSRSKQKNWLDDEEQAWEAIASKGSGKAGKPSDDAWALPSDNKAGKKAGDQSFGDDFGEQLWKAPNPNAERKGGTPSAAASETSVKSQPARPPLTTRISDQPLTKPMSITRTKDKDAFDGLGLFSNEKPAPTLAEARKLRTGLALMSPSTSNANSSLWNESGKPSSSRPPYSTQSQTLALPPAPPLQPSSSGSSWSSQPPTSRPSSSQQTPSASAETRFPSLEELDATFSSGSSPAHLPVSTKAGPHAASQPSLSKASEVQTQHSNTSFVAGRSSRLGLPSGSSGTDGTRSEQITGIAMRGGASTPGPIPTSSNDHSDRPSLARGSSIRRHRSSLTMKQTSPQMETSPTPTTRAYNQESSSTSTQRDWLTGDDNISEVPPPSPRSTNGPVLRDSPSKRASFIQKSTIQYQKAVPVTHDRAPSPSRASHILTIPNSATSAEPDSPSTRFHRVFPELDTTVEPSKSLIDNRSPTDTKAVSASKRYQEPVSSGDEEGPEEASGKYIPSATNQDSRKSRQKGHKGRQSSVHDLVDLWGGGVTKEKETARSTITPAPNPIVLDKRRSLAAPPSPRKNSLSPHHSPTYLETPSTVSSPPLASPTSSTSSRSRPQSMFLFPSKGGDHSISPPASNSMELRSPTSSSLLPPADPQPRRTTRRTSISDMVQRYETIDATARGSTPKPAAVRVSNLPTPDNLPPRSPAIRRGYSNGKPPSLLDDSVEEKQTMSQVRSVSSSIPKSSISGLPRKASPAPSESDKTQEGEPPARLRQPSTKFESTTPFPSQKPVTEDIRNPQDTRSPSPERPYQGVGRLIDQWQRKTAETEATRTPVPAKRGGGFVAKRAGIVNTGTSNK